MNTILKRVISLMLCFVLVAGYLPAGAFAAETGETVTSEVTTEPTGTASTETTGAAEATTAPATVPTTIATEAPTEGTTAPAEETEPSTEGSEPSTEATEATEPAVIAVTGITLDVTELEVGMGESEPVKLTATVTPEDATDKTVTWTSSEPGVASVDKNGVVTFGYMGEAVITATAGEFSATCAVTVDEGEASWYEYTGPDYLDAAIFCSDVHGSTSDLTSVMGGVATSGVDYSSIGFVGDTCLTVANTASAVNSKLGYTPTVMFSYASSHDNENSADISTNWNYSGEVEGVSDYYLVYTIRETDMQNASGANTAAPAFTSWYNGLRDADKALPIFIMSHRPLHDRRDDNAGAATWYDAISAAAESSDITFFWGHNHTSESNVDTAAYYVAKDGTETFTVYNGDTVTPNFTYMNAGYINANNQNPARKGIATTVRITDDSLIFQDYNSSGEYSGTYAHNVTVAREFAASEPTAPTLSSIAITTLPTKTEYYVGDAFSPLGMVVTATYSDGTTKTVDYTYNVDMSEAGTAAVTVSYEEGGITCTATTDITINAVQLNSIAVTTRPTKLTYTVGEELDTTGMVVTGTYNNGTTAEVTGWYVSNVDMSTAGEKEVTVNYAVDSITYKTTFTITVEEGVADGLVLQRIEVKKAPTKTEYLLSEELNLDGIGVAAYFTDGTEGAEETEYLLNYAPFTKDALGGYTLDNFSMYVKKAHEVTVTYTYGDVTCTDTFTINVWNEDFADENSGVKVHVAAGDYGVTAVNVADSENTYVATAVAEVISGTNYKAYDITLTLDTDVDEAGEAVYALTEGEKTVTLPIPSGVTNPVVYYVSDDGATVENMNAVKDGDNVTFTTTHFSTYVIGESTEIEVPENETASGSGSTTTTTKKTVYVLTSSISSGNDYLIVNGNSAGSYYALANNSGSVAATGVTVKTDSEIGTYIELDDATDELWTVSNSYRFQNNGYYLRYNNGLGLSSDNYTTWSYSSNRLSYRSGRTTYYLRYNNGWTTTSSSSSASSIYFYVPTEIEVDTTTTVSGTYEIKGEDLSAAVSEGSTANLTSTLTFTPSDGGTATTTDVSTTAAYEIVFVDANGNTVNGDPNGIISKIENGVVTFTGKYGEALVKVSYTTDFGEVTDYIVVEAKAPYYTIELCDPVTDDDDNTTYEPITKPVALKGIEAGDTYSVWAVVKEYDGVVENGEDGKDLGDVEDDRLLWAVSDTSIATIDSATGVITFTGNNYGTFEVTVYYLDENDRVLCEDTITISAAESQYVVPGDGTNDFPEYPDQGAIRIDKTAVAQGNFSESGIAKVELSMTGVPYGTNAKTDVVVMVDMTASMSNDDVTAAESAVQELIESLVYDEENNKYDSNIQLFIDVFYSASSDSGFETEEYLNCVTISNATELAAAKAKINFTQSSQGGGTRYNLAMKDVYETLNREGHADNQFVVFVSDGVATAYAPLTNGTLGTTITGQNSTTGSLAAGWFDDDGEVTDEFETEYYSYLIKTAGIPIYTVGANLAALSDAADVLNHMSSNYSPDGKTSTGQTKYSFFCTTSGGITDEVLEIFHGIGTDIREAATNVVVEDKIDSHYTVNFSLPSGVTATEAGMDDFYIQVLGYELDENNERKENPTVLEKFLFNSDGTITHTIGATTCEECTHVTKTGDKITGIDGTYFDYTVDAKGDEFLTWTADKLDRTELALEYFVYLDNSAGDVPAANQIEPGTYNTNEYATITYTNYNGKECQQDFPVPSMTWKGAQVTYVFYLVNEAGQPVNRAGKIIPFAESFYVTDPVTIDVTWNELEGSENMLAENLLAVANVPEVYSLYDDSAYYEIRVYQTEGVDSETQAKNYNYFIIEGSDTVSNKETTKVFNTKAGNRYDDYGAYSATAGTYTSHNSNASYTATVTTGIDYANTTVAFAVVWKPELVPDTVVVDYGLDVVIDVTINDALASGVTGVSTKAPDAVINSGTYQNSVMGESADILIDGLIVGTAKKESLTSVRFSLNKSSGMQFNKPVEFFYESGCNYYTYDSAGNRTLNTTHMYSSVTVIPATTVYYEDEYVDFEVYTDEDDKLVWTDNADDGYNATDRVWDVVGNTVSKVQDTDRPGINKISEAYDADNNYGYDSAYKNMSTYSMGSARKLTVDSTYFGKAKFSFYGTGFDVIGLTSNQTGVIVIQIKDTSGNVTSKIVDTYYGYTKVNGEWVVSVNEPNALYQVPVMKVDGLDYGKYDVTITAAYNSALAHNNATSYDLYLDAIRIYDPTGVAGGWAEDETVSDAYVADEEGWPIYEEVRNNIIAASSYSVSKDANGNVTVTGDDLAGAIFIDSADGTKSIADYVSYGPNNELYLASGQSVAFEIDPAHAAILADVQIAMKLANGTSAAYTIANSANSKTTNGTLTTATDMYYSIKEHVDGVITVTNTGDGILSLTNIKVTHTENPFAIATNSLLRMTSGGAAWALRTVTEDETEDEVVEPETTEPESTETEATEPEATEPETSEPEVTEPETTVPEETESEDEGEKVEETIKEVVQSVVNTVVNALKNLFGRWFR